MPTSLDIITMLKAEVHKEKQSLNPFSDSFDADKLRKMLTNKVENQFRWKSQMKKTLDRGIIKELFQLKFILLLK